MEAASRPERDRQIERARDSYPDVGKALRESIAQALELGDGLSRDSRVLLAVYSLGLALPFLLTAFALDRFLVWFQRFRPYLVWVERISGVLLILLGILLVTDRFTLLANWLQGLTPEALKSRL